ncbi:phosphate acetyltransferase [Candidatus Woesearchaeota archaeon]|nr:MAG: phosphate acetyltransferase [Candidatus Woesearchaeota archaeon]
MSIIKRIMREAKKSNKKIVFTDYEDDTLYKALKRIVKLRLATPVLVGDDAVIGEKIKHYRLKGVEVINPEKDSRLESFRDEYYSLRKHKGISLEEAYETIKNRGFFGAMLVRKGFADGMVSGLSSETKPFFPAFHIIKTKPGIERASGLFIMDFKDKTLFFADCALNIFPTSEQLSEIAISAADFVRELGVEPRVAMLSFSTYGSAKHELVDKVKRATELVKQRKPDLIVDGEIQFDAAFVPRVCEKKCKGSPLGGKANVFIFPNLDAGNIGYKLVERLAHAKAIGPILLGLNAPINDISRGASAEDVVNITAITVIQAKESRD